MEFTHPFEKNLSYLFGVIFTDHQKSVKSKLFNLCIYADASVSW